MTMTLKELVDADIERVFVNIDDLAETHNVNGEDIVCVLDSDAYTQRVPEIGVQTAEIRLFARSTDIGDRQEAGDVVVIDGSLYVIVSWQENMGLAQITLSSAHGA